MKRFGAAIMAVVGLVVALGAPVAALGFGGFTERTYAWNEVNPAAPWGRRAGLQVQYLDGKLYLMGGRTPRPPSTPVIPGDSDIHADVWTSADQGGTWEQVLATDTPGHWPARAYFSSVTLGGYLYVIGGQDYEVVPNPCTLPFCPPLVSQSDFFRDVWRSRDGVHWEQRTAQAPWEGRAGLSAAALNGALYVFGGSQNDDAAIIGGPPARIYFRDVWKSTDGGATWQKVADAPWAARAGAATVVKDGYIYLLGGEKGFLCSPFPGCTLPYFNDVWRTRDGATWQLVNPSAPWSPRPGHKCEALVSRIVCFGGFGLPENPMDVWESTNGAVWKLVRRTAWNATNPAQIRYDFATAVVPGGPFGLTSSILTFGGDRETFNFSDPVNYLRVDDDVWRLRLTPAG